MSLHVKHLPGLCRAAFSGNMPPEEVDVGFIPLEDMQFFFHPRHGIGYGPEVPDGVVEITFHAGSHTNEVVLREMDEPLVTIEIYDDHRVEVFRREP